MISYPLIVKAKKEARDIFLGIAIPCDKSTVDGGFIRSEKVLKFSRKILRRSTKVKTTTVDPRIVGGVDGMIVTVGLPGSVERVQALTEQYAAILLSNEELSPFKD